MKTGKQDGLSSRTHEPWTFVAYEASTYVWNNHGDKLFQVWCQRRGNNVMGRRGRLGAIACHKDAQIDNLVHGGGEREVVVQEHLAHTVLANKGLDLAKYVQP